MNFTNIASFAAILIASVQAANINACNLPTSNQTTSSDITSGASNVSSAATSQTSNNGVSAGQNPNNTTTTNASSTSSSNSGVARSTSVDEKVQKIMSLGLTKFGELNQDKVMSFLNPEEWGRVDYNNNYFKNKSEKF